MKKHLILMALASLVAMSAHAALTERVLQDDATDLEVVSSEKSDVVVKQWQTCDWSNEGPYCTWHYKTAPGLTVTVNYTAKDAFTEIQGDSTLTVDNGAYEVEIPGATTFVSAKIVSKDITKTVVDDEKSEICDRDTENNIREPGCEDKYAYKTYKAPGKVLQIETK